MQAYRLAAFCKYKYEIMSYLIDSQGSQVHLYFSELIIGKGATAQKFS